MRLEWVHTSADAHVIDVDILVCEDAEPPPVGCLIEEVVSFILGRRPTDLVGVHRNADRTEALRHAQELATVFGVAPFVVLVEGRDHVEEVGFEAALTQRPDKTAGP